MTDVSPNIVLLFICLALFGSATFSLFETAFLSSRRHRLSQLKASEKLGAKRALTLLDDMDGLLTTILLWNNFANVAIASLATLLAVQLLGDSELTLSVTNVATTLVILLFAEITPKTFGVRYPETIACFSSLILLALVKLSTPIVVMIKYFIRIIHRSKQENTISRIATDELMALVSDNHTLSEVNDQHRSMLLKLINIYNLSMHALMVPREQIEFIDLEDSQETILEDIVSTKHSILPITEGGLGNVIGVIRSHKIFKFAIDGKLTAQVIKQELIKPFFTPVTLEPISALYEMIERKREMCLVVDEYGGLIGMVTIHDIMRHLAGRQTDNPYLISGEESIREINLRLGINLPTDSFQTIGGLIADEVSLFPEHPMCLQINNIRLIVETIDEKDIKVRILPPKSN